MKALTLLKQDIQQWNQWRASHNHEPCSLAHADLSNGYFFEGDFRGVDLSGTVLASACLIGANLQGANLRGANLRGAYLDKANLNGADIRDADFRQAHIASVDLRNARVENALFTDANSTRVIIDSEPHGAFQQAKTPVLPEVSAKVSGAEKTVVIREKNQDSVTKEPSIKALQSIAAGSSSVVSSAQNSAVALVSKDEGLPISYQSAQQLFDQLPFVGDNSDAMYEAVIVPLKPSTQDTDTLPNGETAVQSSEQTSEQESEQTGQQASKQESSSSLWLNRTVGISEAIGAVAILILLCFIAGGRTFRQQQASEALSAVQSKTEQAVEAANEQPPLVADSIAEFSPVWAIATYSENDRDIIVSGNEAGEITFRDQESGEIIRTLEAHTDAIRDIAIAPDTRHLVSSSSDGINVWDLDTTDLLYSLSAPAPVWSVAVTPDEERFISSDYDGNITVWHLYTGNFLYNIAHGSTVWSVAVAPDGASIVSGGSDRDIHQWDLETGELLQSFTGHQGDVRTLAITPDGETLVSGSWDSTIKLWSLASGELDATLEEHRDRVVSLAISPDGEKLASGSIDSTAKLWNLSTQLPLNTLEEHTDWVLSTAFTPQSSTLVTGSKDTSMKVWK